MVWEDATTFPKECLPYDRVTFCKTQFFEMYALRTPSTVPDTRYFLHVFNASHPPRNNPMTSFAEVRSYVASERARMMAAA